MSDEGRLVAGRYRIVRRIGSGAMGAVWQAYDEVLARTVAIKQLLLQPGLDQHEAEDAKQRTMREGRIAARLHHPNAITVFDVVTDDNGHPCLVMEYLPSTSLAELLREQKTLPPVEVARIGAQVAAALKEAHAVGIVHRDIKPGNILLADNGVVKITDFGISRAKDDVTVTKTGMIAGTPAYLAPEVAVGADPGPASDIFSLGSTLYAACEGQPPFGLSENTLSLLHAVAAGQINPPRQSGPMAGVLTMLLDPEASRRPTAAEAEEMLDAVARGQTPLSGPADDPTRLAGAAGMLGAARGTRALPTEGVTQPANLGGGQTARYYDGYDDGYGRTAAYPVDDYDEVGQQYPGGHDAYHSDYDNRGYDNRGYDNRGYDNRPDDGYRHDYEGAYGSDRERDPNGRRPGKWKAAAIAGGAAVVLIGLVVWLFSPNKKVDNTSDNTPGPVTPTTATTTFVETTETATETVTASNSEVETSTSRSSRHSSENQEASSSHETSASSSTKASHNSPPPSSPSKPSATSSPTTAPSEQ